MEATEKTPEQELRLQLRGELIEPGDDGYEDARKIWNGMIDKRPAMIVRCTGVADVIRAVKFAKARNILVAVRGGGHNVAGNAVCDGGMVIDLSRMKGIRVDPRALRARAEGGVTWGELDRETQTFGLATPGGVVSTTGIAGLTLGGGWGWLRRKYGLSCDNLRSVDLVTADGELLTANEAENPDLFWGVRGGGGNFGVVTSFEYRLHPVGPEVMLAAPLYAEEKAPKILRAWRDFCANAPDEVTSEVDFWAIPELPGVAKELYGRRVLAIPTVYAGPADEGERVLQATREFDTPVLDLSAREPYTTVQTAFDPFFPKGTQLYYWKSLYLDRLGDDVIGAICSLTADRPSMKTLVNISQMGGAMARVHPEDTAYGRRDAPFLLSIDSTWVDPKDTERNIGWTRKFWKSMERFSYGGLYLNFPGLGEEGDALVRAAYGANYDRLVALKQKYDPENFFRLNQNINPKSG
ncbi:MAG TPA: FAD-binding oxidoreductase [Thermoplasmata archaeon]